MEKHKTSNYLRYAFGEIGLVVIGILIAIQINNWNTQRQEANKLITIYERILEDMDNDIQELSATMNFLDSIRPIFEKVRHDSITPDLLDQGISRILAEYYMTSLNKTGVNQLKETANKDSLSMQIIEIYNLMENNLILPNEKRVMEKQDELTSKFMNYSWYPEWMSKTIMKDNSSKELQDYFLYSEEYRNYVFYMYQQLYVNYHQSLQTSIAALKGIKVKINDKIMRENQ
jgi:hypothetical protein